jgi:ATP-dependent protease HslVU (ClpYQ) peptidase subunit
MTWGDTKIHGAKKLLDAGRFIIGISGPARLGTLIEESRTRFTKAHTPQGIAKILRDLIAKDEWRSDESGTGPRCADVAILLCDQKTGRIFWLDGSFTVDEVNEGRFIALGTGGDVAMGAMAALGKLKPKDRVRRALQIVCQFSASCGGELDIREIQHE